jgi:hypothetical protein
LTGLRRTIDGSGGQAACAAGEVDISLGGDKEVSDGQGTIDVYIAGGVD